MLMYYYYYLLSNKKSLGMQQHVGKLLFSSAQFQRAPYYISKLKFLVASNNKY